MMKQLLKLVDVKSIVTLALVFALIVIVMCNKKLDEKVFLLFSNVVTMVITYFFTKPKNTEDNSK